MIRHIVLTCCILLGLTGLAIAGDSVTIKLSCVIPAIPGINAPAIAEAPAPQTEEPALEPQDDDNATSQDTESETVIVKLLLQEREILNTLSDGRQYAVTERTIYSR